MCVCARPNRYSEMWITCTCGNCPHGHNIIAGKVTQHARRSVLNVRLIYGKWITKLNSSSRTDFPKGKDIRICANGPLQMAADVGRVCVCVRVHSSMKTNNSSCRRQRVDDLSNFMPSLRALHRFFSTKSIGDPSEPECVCRVSVCLCLNARLPLKFQRRSYWRKK